MVRQEAEVTQHLEHTHRWGQEEVQSKVLLLIHSDEFTDECWSLGHTFSDTVLYSECSFVLILPFEPLNYHSK